MSSKTRDIFLQMESFELLEENYKNDYCEITQISAHADISTLSQPNRAFFVKSESDNETIFETRTAQSSIAVWQREVKCKCPVGPTGDYCRRATIEAKRKASAPQQRASCPNVYPEIGESVLGPSANRTAVVGNTLRIVSPGNGQSLLRPSHFSKIMAGSCRNSTASYERCAQYAYIAKGEHCNDMPPECLNDDFYLGGRPIPAGTSRR